MREVYPNELYHHGVKGQKWGVRRYQNPDGTLTKAGRRHAMRTYNYKESDAYVNGTKGEKAHQTQAYNANKRLFGEKTANKIEYKVNVEGKSRSKEQRKEFAGRMTLGVLLTAAPDLINLGAQYVERGRSAVYLNNMAVTQLASANGLKEVKGGFTTGFSAVQRGKKVAEKILKAAG